MNGVHDMGGMDGFGKVEPEANEPVFHAPWEGRVMAMMRAMGAAGAFNLDMFRDTREHQPADSYLTASYYKSWERCIETLALGHGLVAPDELAAGRSLYPAKPLRRGPLRKQDVPNTLKRGSYGRPAAAPARFKIGDHVRAKNMHPTTHTRLPRYCRGRSGVIERMHGCQVFPDSSALGLGDDPQWRYTVVFEGRELWGADSDPTLKASIDAFEPYLEPA
jgi:nitrile hydratase subunit beta